MTEDEKQPEWLKNVKVGDMLIPRELWNATTSWEGNKLNDPTEVLDIKENCFVVSLRGGEKTLLNHFWFVGIAPSQTRIFP